MVHLAFLADKKVKIYISFIIICSIVFGCTNISVNPQKEIPREIVMSDGMKICASDNHEQICIVADGDTKRIISWGGEEHSINLIPRKKRWHGELGLISPKQPENIWKTKKGSIRALIREAQIKYKKLEHAVDKLSFPFAKKDGWRIVYNDQGLLIMWHETVLPVYNTLDISIYQILIDGKKPTGIPGSKNEQIIVTRQN